ncbi:MULTISPECIES: hypothetical protein [unclassified Streptomyces]|uniref:hypothetical protein n=1 Tax=unclassified Streptomyces TaxID=2593676 RepID=UPI00137003A5|nr:hypothetical protein [Streptomyces sp. SID335]MYZ14506.1 hypothetical protein [Streptomyces sp. SID337]NDZ92045.1 hypothetical protein [Streptomyces sp. SID10115]NEA03636.1 hypothetical protein [Streptomyces sp. SID10116]NEB50361.1 hypothetical protein [Streptomyces sp. SID339]
MTRVLALLMIAVSLPLAAGSALVFTKWLPDDVARYEDYRASERCPSRLTPEAWWEDCLREVELTVVDTVVKSGGKSSEYTATVDGKRFHGERLHGKQFHGVLDFGDPGPLLRTLEAGDRAVGTVWRGDIVALTKDGVRQKTSDEPRDEPQMIAAAGAGLGLLAVLGLVFGTVRLLAPRHSGPFTWKGSGKGLLVTSVVATFGVGLPAVWLGLPWQFVAPVIVAVVLGAGVLLLGGGHRGSAVPGAR